MSAAVITLRRKSAPPLLPEQERKRFATLQAELALRGVPLERMADGTFVAQGLFGPVKLRDLVAVEAFSRELGA